MFLIKVAKNSNENSKFTIIMIYKVKDMIIFIPN